MPETDSAQKKLERKQVEHNQRMVDIENEFNEKLKIYQDKLADKDNPMSVLEQQDREDELGKIQERRKMGLLIFQIQAQGPLFIPHPVHWIYYPW